MLQTNLGLNEMELKRLQDLAQLDVDAISFNTGLDAAEAMNLKNMFGHGTTTEGTVEGGTGNPLDIIGGTLRSVGKIKELAGGFSNAF